MERGRSCAPITLRSQGGGLPDIIACTRADDVFDRLRRWQLHRMDMRADHLRRGGAADGEHEQQMAAGEGCNFRADAIVAVIECAPDLSDTSPKPTASMKR